ncbi:MAG: cytochrome c biogenesis protein CcdA [Planctomycetaceae bacterium]|nr:thioredoxin family protein [Planctomycetaceae bacterium]
MRPLTVLLCIALAAPIAAGQGFFGAGASNITAAAVPSHTRVAPGQKLHLAVVLAIEPNWVFYGPDPGDVAQAGEIIVESDHLKAQPVLWPPTHRKVTKAGAETLVNNVYAGRTVVYVPLEVPGDAKAGPRAIRAKVEGQICHKDGTCVPLQNLAAETSVTVAGEALVNPAWAADETLAGGLKDAKPHEAAPKTAAATTSAREPAAATQMPDIAPMEFVVYGQQQDFSLWAGLALAVLAGLILNIMPCVLPVIPLKVMSIVQQAGQSRRRFVTMGLAFAGGVLLFFVALAILNLVLKQVQGAGFEWAAQWQNDGIRIAMAMLMVLVAANLFGLFNVTVSGKVAALEGSGGGHWGAAATGLLTGVLATPCSFGILTAALAWAQSLSVLVGSFALLLIGVGMALPYAVLTAFPSLVARLPRPGRWMELFKQSMGFVMLLVAVWLLAGGGGNAYAFWAVGFGVVLAFCLWMWGSWVSYDAPLGRKLRIRGAAVVLAGAAGLWMLWPPTPAGEGSGVHLQPFDWTRITAQREQGKTVIVDLTASWCVTCKTVEAVIYDNAEVAQELKKRDVTAYYGDVTNARLPANALKKALKNEAVPSTVVLGAPGKPAVLLRGIFTREELLEAIDMARNQ